MLNNDRRRIEAFEREWDRRRRQDLARRRLLDRLFLATAILAGGASFALVLGWI